ncbi:TetR/AcrR family transcriptional regulator [Rheinheimera sp.]|uniref:TetR/AcrR family transcriptional regulator n=1 Tax=Rheinheimera sp. TaxID=1869214 RepID=UPI00307D22C9
MEKLSRSEQKRLDIHKAALAEFKEKSFAGASMDAIAERAAVSKRTVYNHFESKEALFQAVTESFWQLSKDVTNVEYDPATDIVVQLENITEAMWQLYSQADFIEKARVLLAEYIRQPQLIEQMIQQVSEKEKGLSRFLAQAHQAGVLQIDDLRMAETQFWGLCKAFAFWPVVFQMHDYSAKRAQIIRSNVQMFVCQYRGRAEK